MSSTPCRNPIEVAFAQNSHDLEHVDATAIYAVRDEGLACQQRIHGATGIGGVPSSGTGRSLHEGRACRRYAQSAEDASGLLDVAATYASEALDASSSRP